MIKAILFDLDDTLLKTFETRVEALKQTGRKYYQMEITDEDIKKHWGLPVTVFLQRLYKNIEVSEKIVKNYYSVRDSFPSIAHDDAIKTIEKLSKKFLLGIITAANKRLAQGDLKAAGFKLEHFFFIQTEEDTKVHKPNPKVFEPILKKLNKKGIKKSEIIFIGDHLVDYYAARDAGIIFYGIPDRTVSKKEFEEKGAKTLKSFSDLLNTLS